MNEYTKLDDTDEFGRNVFMDNRDQIVMVGDLVCYNLSGEIALGKVIDRATSNRYGRTYGKFKIE